ncbi:MAG: M6 family metalloprotease domain-containing protein [Paludibacteraceae bacterium]|nr:M6 family metalloprotease domain-containing protein [Paludibacteraceae bacterium]
MQKILLTLLACVVSVNIYAVIASPEPITLTQADGSTFTAKLVGDEFHSYYTRLDGTPIRLNDKGFWVNDEQVREENEVVRKARQTAQEAQFNSSFPLTGSPRSLVILVNFQDVKFTYKLEDFKRMLNTSGYSENNGVGSARDYFIASSDSVFSPIFDCYGPVTVSQDCAYYGGGGSGNDNLRHVQQMIVEACQLVALEGVDMTQYDTNNDGRLDNVFVYYAGHNEAEHGGANTIWPHRSIVSGSERVDGKLIYDYACTSELRGASGNSMCGIGTFCHEFGHVLGLPDYYDTQRSDRYTIGSWDIMCSGSYNGGGKMPPTYNAGERFQLGWLTPIQLEEAGPYTIDPIETSNTAYLIAQTKHNLSWEDASPNEYWLLENRQHVGWDTPDNALPGTGMLIWHIDYSPTAWAANGPNNDTPLRFDVEEAYGSRGFSSASDPFPGTSNVMQFTPTLHNGEMLDQPILNIFESNGQISFTFKSNGADNFTFVPAALPLLQSSYNPDTKKAVTPAQKMKISGSHLEPGTLRVVSSGSGFTISADSVNWSANMEFEVGEDSTFEQQLYVRYAPRKMVCEVQKGTLAFRHGGGAAGAYTISGTSPRPTLISSPQITSVNEVTPTTFKVHWKPEADAEFYYVTLYHMEDGTESVVEGFENFDDEAVVHEAGWTTNFYRTTTKAKEEGTMSMWFKEDAEQMHSPKYTLPVTNVSLWLSAPSTSDSEVGWIILGGFNEEKEYVLDTIDIKRSTKKFTYSRALDPKLNIRQFKIFYAAFGGEGVCLDAFTTTFNKKTVYTYKGRERTIEAFDGDEAEEYTAFYAYDLIPNTDYFVRLQCSENKGCVEHLTELSEPRLIRTKDGGAIDSKHLTLAYDSISYDPATHVVYIPQSLEPGSVCIYNASGELVKRIPVESTVNVVPLPDAELIRGAIYLIKYLPNEKLSRKSPWIKILYR